MCCGPQRIRCWLCVTVSAATDDEPSGPNTASTATSVTRSSGFFCALAWLTELWVCALAANSSADPVYRISCDIAHDPMQVHTAASEPRPIKFLRLTRVAVRLPWSSYLCVRLLYPQTGVDALAAPHLVFPAGFLCRTSRRRS